MFSPSTATIMQCLADDTLYIIRRPVYSQPIMGIVYLRFWTFSGFKNWSFQWLPRGNLDF